MSHSLSSVSAKDIPAIVLAEPLRIPKAASVVLWLLLFVGAAVFIQGILSSAAHLTWISFHINFVYWLFVAAACAGFASVFQICNAQWARPINRIFQSATPFFAWLLIPLVVLYIGTAFLHSGLFAWEHEAAAGKEIWLTPHFLYARDFLALCLLIFLARKVVMGSVKRDLFAIRSGLTGIDEEKLSRWKNSQKGPEEDSAGALAAVSRFTCTMGYFSPLVIIFYALVMTLIAFDQVMSVDYHWYSTMFGGFMFMSGVYLAVSWAAIGLAFLRELHPLFRAKIERRTLHDLGKLVLGFGIFWAYLFWCHYLPIWYGNIPEETGWIITRLRLEPWHSVSWLVLGTCFIIPFLLGLSRDVKQMPQLLFVTAVIVAVGIWIQTYLLFVPTLYPNEVPLNWRDIFITLGFMGGFLLSASSFLAKVPLMPFGDLIQAGDGEELKKAA